MPQAPQSSRQLGAEVRPVYRVRITPADVGSRVTLRARTGAPPGPTGDPAYTDTVGLLLAWDDEVLVVQRRDGSRARVRAADLVAGHVIPPHPGRTRDRSG